MKKDITAKELRAEPPRVVASVRKGAKFTVVYRSKPAFRIVPVESAESDVPLDEDPFFRAAAVGRSSDGLTSEDHDTILYR